MSDPNRRISATRQSPSLLPVRRRSVPRVSRPLSRLPRITGALTATAVSEFLQMAYDIAKKAAEGDD